MNTITDFSKLGRAGFDKLYADMLKALEPIAAANGIKIKVKGTSVAPGYANITFTASVISESGMVMTPEVEAFKQLAELFNLKPEDLNKKFKTNGEIFQIVGLKSASRKMPILCLNLNNKKQYKFGSDTVKSLLQTNPA